jgi:hypothetical protein
LYCHDRTSCENPRETKCFGKQAITLVLYGRCVNILSKTDCILRPISGNSGIEKDGHLFSLFQILECDMRKEGANSGNSLYHTSVIPLISTFYSFKFGNGASCMKPPSRLFVSDMVPWTVALSLTGFFQVESAFL